ncbi:MAG: prepilin-type N-terminal cleavage/methylation domain-containing protein [Candidatus Kerfeldbacteria bacterium]
MNRRGVTLAEMLVAMFTIAVVGIIVYNVYLVAGTFMNSEQIRIEVDLSASRILTTLNDTLRQAKTVESSHDFDGTTHTTSDTVLVFTLPTKLTADSISSDKVDYGALYVDGSELKYVLDPHDDSIRTAGVTSVADRVKEVYFRYNSPTVALRSAVTITLATQHALVGSTYTQYSILNAHLNNYKQP